MSGISNNQIKFVKSLQQKKVRDEHGLFIVEGEKMVDEAVSSPFKVETIYRRDEIGDEAMGRMTALANPSPVLAVVRKPEDSYIKDASELQPLLQEGGLYLALDAIRDPGNLGTILRIADWFGIKAVFAAPDTVDLFNPKVVQSTMGAIFRLPFAYVDSLDQVMDRCKELGITTYAAHLGGKNNYDKEDYHGGSAFLIGNEGNGLTDHLADQADVFVKIPMAGKAESLNAAVAAAVLVYEAARQRNFA